MDFGNMLIEFRASKGWTQKKLAEFLGISNNMVYRYENGKCKPTAMHKIMFENKIKEEKDL